MRHVITQDGRAERSIATFCFCILLAIQHLYTTLVLRLSGFCLLEALRKLTVKPASWMQD